MKNTILKDFSHQGKRYEYTIMRSKRKSVAISIAADSGIVVKIPLYFMVDEVEKLIIKKADWIVEKYNEIEKQQKEKQAHLFESGEVFYYRGTSLVLNLIVNHDRKRIMVKKQAGTLLVVSPSAEKTAIKDAVEKWYRERAREVITDKVTYFQRFVGKSVGEIRIKEQKSRWGSCSSRGNLNFNWKIVMAPDEIIDYLVVHELCHLLHMNHSKEFWDSVGKIIPDYKEREKWLKEKGAWLSL